MPTLSLAHNLLLTRQEAIAYRRFLGGWIRVKQLEAQAAGIIARFKVKAGGPRSLARSLSGGNLQKFIAVSYTHLDVYKRQIQAQGDAWSA